MVILSFSVPKLWNKLFTGEKTQSMRPVIYQEKSNEKWGKIYEELQQQPNKKIFLQIYWKSRSPYRKFLFNAQLVSMEKHPLGLLSLEEWKTDGFETKEEGLNWFAKTYDVKTGIGNFEVYVIHWKPGNCMDCIYMGKCTKYFDDKDGNPYHLKQVSGEYLCPTFEYRKEKKGEFSPRLISDVMEMDEDDDPIAIQIRNDAIKEERILLKEEKKAGYQGCSYRCSHCQFTADNFHEVTIHVIKTRKCREAERKSPCYPIEIPYINSDLQDSHPKEAEFEESH